MTNRYYTATVTRYINFVRRRVHGDDDSSTSSSETSFSDVPITFICDFMLKYKRTGEDDEESEKISFQLIGLNAFREEGVDFDFSEHVIKGFDLTCVQFVIESPREPTSVRCYSAEAMRLFMEFSFTYDYRKFRGVGTFYRRVAKYMQRGFRLVGIRFSGSVMLSFPVSVLTNENTMEEYDGANGKVTYIFEELLKDPSKAYLVKNEFLRCKAHLIRQDNDFFLYEKRRRRLMQRYEARNRLLRAFRSQISDLRRVECCFPMSVFYQFKNKYI